MPARLFADRILRAGILANVRGHSLAAALRVPNAVDGEFEELMSLGPQTHLYIQIRSVNQMPQGN